MRQDSLGVENAPDRSTRGKQEGQLPRTFGSQERRHRAAAVCARTSTSMRFSEAGTDAFVSWNAAQLYSPVEVPMSDAPVRLVALRRRSLRPVPIRDDRTPAEHLPAVRAGPHGDSC